MAVWICEQCGQPADRDTCRQCGRTRPLGAPDFPEPGSYFAITGRVSNKDTALWDKLKLPVLIIILAFIVWGVVQFGAR